MRRKVSHGLWKSRHDDGRHFKVQYQKASMPPMRFKGTAFASGHPHEKEGFKDRALNRLHMIIASAKIQAASGTPSGLDRALKYLEREFKVGAHGAQAAFGSYGIAAIENEQFYRDAKQTVINARFMFNEALQTNDENRRTTLFEEAAATILNLDANIPFVPKPIAPKEEKPSVSVKVTPKIYTQRPRRRGKPTASEKATPTIEKIKEKLKGAPKTAQEAAQRMKLPEASWRIRRRKEEEKPDKEYEPLEKSAAATRESVRRMLSGE
jgi:hypothetical protein